MNRMKKSECFFSLHFLGGGGEMRCCCCCCFSEAHRLNKFYRRCQKQRTCEYQKQQRSQQTWLDRLAAAINSFVHIIERLISPWSTGEGERREKEGKEKRERGGKVEKSERDRGERKRERESKGKEEGEWKQEACSEYYNASELCEKLP